MLNMAIHPVQSVTNAIPLGWLTSPVFGNDLRVASRRKQSYRLRFAYVVLLTVLIAIVWIPAMEFQTSAAMSRAQMEVAAKTITMGIVGFLALSISNLCFLGCTGLYLSSRIRRTTAAVTAHLVLVAGIWLILPSGAFAVADVLDHAGLTRADSSRVAEHVSWFVPVAQAFLLIDPLLEGHVGGFEWAGFHGAWGFLLMVMTVAGSYILLGLPFVARAVKAFRRTASDAHV